MRKQYKNNAMVQTVFDNRADIRFNPVKKFYAFLNLDGKDHYTEYESISRADATKQFAFEAKALRGTFNGKVYSF